MLHSLGTAHNIIERRQFLHQVETSEERFRKLLQVAGDGVHILDESGNLIMWSDSFFRMLGYDEDAERPLNVSDWDVAISQEELIPHLLKLITTPEVFETRHRRRDGSEFDVEINAGGIELAGKRYLYASSRDITERKAHDEELRQARFAAESAVKAKSNFLATMSHEIRTPITGVLGMVDLLYKTNPTEEQVTYINILQASTQTLLTILNDILDISKIDANKITIEATTFDLYKTVNDVIALGCLSASSKGITIKSTISKNVPTIVISDQTRIKQVLFNLLSNAIKFTELGEIEIRIMTKHNTDQNATVLFEVEDSGIGISREVIDQLFTAFSQADQTTTRRFGGTGLGLAISKKLVELMGGKIGVESESGIGSLFWFTLPLTLGTAAGLPVDASRPQKPLPLASSQRSLRVLLAEDNRINQILVRSMLQKLGHVIQVVENGRQALEAVRAEEWDIVLMDMQMPEMDGEEATKAIRALPPPKNRIPVLALTADVLTEHQERYIRAGINDLVPKPIDWQVLSDALLKHTRTSDDASHTNALNDKLSTIGKSGPL
ncbi:two-component system, sensor histidine kinase [Azospirillaceae bacterium]